MLGDVEAFVVATGVFPRESRGDSEEEGVALRLRRAREDFTPEDEAVLRRLIEDHFRYTASTNADRVLRNWDEFLPRFVKVMPRAYKRVIAERAADAVSDADLVEMAGDG